MTKKRYKAIPEVVSYKDTVTGEVLCPKFEGDYYKVLDLLNENEQLKQRNERQYNQLNELWGLIKNKEWETLTQMVKQMKEDEERLQKEWKCYE